jgi:MFS transporter, SP family, sugar:H+ symporter
MMFQLAITIGIFVANILNYLFSKMKNGEGWRYSLGLAAVPAIMIIIGAIFLPDTPSSLIERGQNDKAKKELISIRGTTDVDEEFQDLVAASDISKTVEHPWASLLMRPYRPHLTMAIVIPFFHQLTNMNVITFYAPVLFKTIGFSGPLDWLVPSEIFPPEVRSATQRFNVSVNMICIFVIAQIFTTILCCMKFGLFIFFTFFVVVMTPFIYKLLPETKGVPIEEMSTVWEKHPYWSDFVKVEPIPKDQELGKC